MMSAKSMERIRKALYVLSVIEIVAHIAGMLGHFAFHYYIFGLSLIHYPIGKVAGETLGIAASIVLGIGAWLKHDMTIFSYIVFGTLYLILHFICSSFMLKFMFRFLGFNLGQIQNFLYPSVGTIVLLLINMGTAIFYIAHDTEEEGMKGKDESNVASITTDVQLQLDNLGDKPSTSAAAIEAVAAANAIAEELV